jgi:membrane protease YdiL (CAAX protease family)
MPVSLWAIISGLLIALVPANVWLPLLRSLGVPLATTTEAVFLAAYLWWASGGGPPVKWKMARRAAFRSRALTPTQWMWGILAALSFAASVHAAIVLLFRLVPFPVESFRHDYDVSYIPTLPLKWIAAVVSAASAGICEETGFRGYMQQPIEERHGAPAAIFVSSILFMLLHLTKSWSLVGMVPIVFGAGVLLGILAWASGSLIPAMIGHVMMDIGLFAYWWTGIAGDFTARPIGETGVDTPFLIASAVLAIMLGTVLFAARRLRQLNQIESIFNTAGGPSRLTAFIPLFRLVSGAAELSRRCSSWQCRCSLLAPRQAALGCGPRRRHEARSISGPSCRLRRVRRVGGT